MRFAWRQGANFGASRDNPWFDLVGEAAHPAVIATVIATVIEIVRAEEKR